MVDSLLVIPLQHFWVLFHNTLGFSCGLNFLNSWVNEWFLFSDCLWSSGLFPRARRLSEGSAVIQKGKQNGFGLSLNTSSAVSKWKINGLIKKKLNILGEWKWLLRSDTLGKGLKWLILCKSDQTRKWQLNLKHMYKALENQILNTLGFFKNLKIIEITKEWKSVRNP